MTTKANLTLMAAAVTVVLMGAGSAWADLTDGLVAHWKLDGDATDSAGTNHGTIHGATSTTGQIGGALDFDGVNDYIRCGDILDNEIKNVFTIGVWIKLGEGALQKARNYVLWKGDDRPGIRVHTDGKVVFLHWYSGVGSGLHSTHVLEEGKWYHISYVFNGSEFIGYINAEYAGAASDIGYSPGGSLLIASDTDPDRYFKGTIDDVRIYNRALSSEEIQELYQAELAELISLEIVGSEEAAENSQTRYKAIAHYDNNSTADVTGSVDWSVETNDIVSIAGGVLTTEMVDLPEDVLITAKYSEGDVNQIAQKDVSILAICPSGSALKFDGSDDYVISDIGSTIGNISYAFWFKSDNVNITKRIVTRDWSDSGSFTTAHLAHIGGKLEAIFRYSNGAQGPSLFSDPILSNKWYHVCCIYDGTNVKFYLNGLLVDQAGQTSIVMDSKPLYIGARNYDYKGLIDEVTIYNRALSAEEIQELMHTRPDTDDLTLVGYWSFDEGEGDIAGDSSGNGNDGTIMGAQWTDDISPVGICNAKDLVERNLLRVFEMKETVLEILEDAIATEDATKEFLDELFKSGQTDGLKKSDVATAKQKIMGAIQQEEQAETSIDNSINKLDDAMNTLGIE